MELELVNFFSSLSLDHLPYFQKMQRMGEIVFFMTKNEKIKKQIKCEDYDQYEELMELAEESLTF